MNTRLQQYIEAGKQLDPDERELAALALQYIDPEEKARVEAAWTKEIERRLDEVLNGEVELVDSHETIARGRKRLQELRGAR